MNFQIIFEKGIRFLKNKNYRFLVMSYLGFYNYLGDEDFLKKMYQVRIGKELNLENPKSFNEKMQWLKLNNRKPEYTNLVDKYEVKKYISEKLGEEYVIPTFGIWDSFDEIEFERLPQQFVLKCTHDSGGIAICTDKSTFDIKKAKKKLNRSLKRNFYLFGREWPYKNIKPRIIAEKYIKDSADNLKDYKMMCFNGKFKCCFSCFDRNEKGKAKIIVFDNNWKNMEFGRNTIYHEQIKKPKNYQKMIQLSEKIAQDFPFLRVDFYEVNQSIYFGEITFFPGSGFEKFTPEEWDYKLGSWIKLFD